MASKIVLYIAMTLDGFIAKENGSVDFLDKYNQSGEDYNYKIFYKAVDSIIMGNTTYSQFGDKKEFMDFYKNKPIFVFTRKLKDKKNKENITFVNEDVVKFHKNMKFEYTWLLGGGSIVKSFLEKGLIDEFIITIIPEFLGKGIRLFQDCDSFGNLKIKDIKRFKMNVIQITYGRRENI
ncbi:MAG: dihydrofolate reductase [Nanoarchaeota archaeon]|nr:dihydrofolate reductase [Nanoarchaeota archaeon]